MDVRRPAVGVVEGPDADEAYGGTGLGIIAPDADSARGASGARSPVAAQRWRHHHRRRTGEMGDAIGFVQGVERERRSGLTLTPAAVARMNDERRAVEPIAHATTRAATFRSWPLVPEPLIDHRGSSTHVACSLKPHCHRCHRAYPCFHGLAATQRPDDPAHEPGLQTTSL